MVEAITQEVALQPQVPYTPPEPVAEACLASEATGYMQQIEALDAAYQTALASGRATPEQLTTLAGEMEAVAEEAAAWGCGGVAAEAQRRAQDIAEAARYAQEAQFMQEWVQSPGLPLHLPDFFGVRVEGTIELGPLMVDVNADLLFFPETGELALFLSNPISFQVQPKQVSWGVGAGGSMTSGIVWGEGKTPEDYAGFAWVQGVHTPPTVLPVGEMVIPIPGIEFERAVSNTATAFYLGGTGQLTEIGIYEVPSYSYPVFKLSLGGAK